MFFMTVIVTYGFKYGKYIVYVVICIYIIILTSKKDASE